MLEPENNSGQTRSPISGGTRPPSGRRPVRKQTSEKAVFAFLLGIAGLAMWIFTAVPAIILGAMARGEIAKDDSKTGGGIALAGILLGIVGIFAAPAFVLLLILGLGQAGGSRSVDVSERVVHMHLSGAFAESPSTNPFDALSGGVRPLLIDFIDTIYEAAADESVLAVVITVDRFFPESAHNEEIHCALHALIESGTDIYIHNEEAVLSTPQYALLTASTHFNSVPTAELNLVGFYGEGMYVKDGLESIGVAADIVHIGDYKSAGEMMMRNEPSPAAAEAMDWLYDGLYDARIKMIANSRNMEAMDVRSAIDSGPYSAEEAEKVGLIDSVMYQDELMDMIRERYGEDIYIDDYYGSYERLSNTGTPGFFSSGGTVGLVVLEGTIMPGYGDVGALSGTLRWALEAAAEDPSVDAVVLRVNSPGGSVTASEVILRAVEQVKAEKPIVVSMGSVAASGGYYVACKADKIFADEMTITGSIGVVGGKIVTAELWDELGINWHSIQRGENANWASSSSRFSDEQREQIEQSMTAAYDVFKAHVEEGRGDRLNGDLESMAGGRVFTGIQAKELGLVDEIGGLHEAIESAAEAAGLDDYSVRMIPRQMTFSELLSAEFFGGPGPANPSDLAHVEGAVNQLDLKMAMSQAMSSRNVSSTAAILAELEPQRAREMMRWIAFATLINEQKVVAVAPHLPVVQ